ncbi:hypothetical protein [Bacteroides salyersiae]|uniref:hypothetical protein n=1 Tax=Bacteroides salyersiae TaxID=291644 RepID=UPI001C8C7EBE|nr:hypothetical protein [Bacteroides salyersiae]
MKMGCCLSSEIDDFIVRWTKWGLYSLGYLLVLVLKKVLLRFPRFHRAVGIFIRIMGLYCPKDNSILLPIQYINLSLLHLLYICLCDQLATTVSVLVTLI